MKSIYILFLGFISFMVVSCDSDFPLKNRSNENDLPVISGWIGDVPNNYSIRVLWSNDALDVSSERVILGAQVVLHNDVGHQFVAVYNEVTRKYHLPEQFHAETGITYWIEVTLPDGRIFQSSQELVRETVPIKEILADKSRSILWSEENSNTEYPIDIYDIKLTFSDPAEEANYYYWEIQDLYRYAEGFDFFVIAQQPFSSDDGFSDGEAKIKIAERWISEDAGHRDKGTAIRVSLFTVSYSGYQYLSSLNKFYHFQKLHPSERNSSIDFENLLNVEGNIFESGNPTNIGLGFFGVVGRSQKSIEINPHWSEPEVVAGFERGCRLRIANSELRAFEGYENCTTRGVVQGKEYYGRMQYDLLVSSSWGVTMFDPYFQGEQYKIRLTSDSNDVRLVSNIGKDHAVLSIVVNSGYSGTAHLAVIADALSSSAKLEIEVTVE